MTLILAAKHSEGILYCSDTIVYGDNASDIAGSSFNKVLQANNTPIVRGIAGVVPERDGENFILDDISNFYNYGERTSEETILKIVGKYKITSSFMFSNILKRMFGKDKQYAKDLVQTSINEYLFSWNQNEEFNLCRVNLLYGSFNKVSYSAIGFGAYTQVKNFLNKYYKSGFDKSSVIHLLIDAFEIALLENKKFNDTEVKSANSKYVLSGRAIVNHTSSGLEQILFQPDYSIE